MPLKGISLSINYFKAAKLLYFSVGFLADSFLQFFRFVLRKMFYCHEMCAVQHIHG